MSKVLVDSKRNITGRTYPPVTLSIVMPGVWK